MSLRLAPAALARLGADPPPAPRLVCLGLTALDLVWSVQSLPCGSGKLRARSFAEGGGGMAANAAVAAARLGADVHFWGRAGNDRAGVAMRDALAAEGVDVTALRCFDGAVSSVSGIVVDASGERSIVNFRGEGLPAAPDWLPLHEVARASAVLADPRWPEGAIALFDAARRASVPTVLDGDVADAEVFDSLLGRVDYAIFSQPGLAAYAGGGPGVDADAGAGLARQLDHALARGCRLAAVTLGERGVVWDDGQGLRRLDAPRVDVVDTTGAGDVFHGAFCFAIGAGLGVGDAFVLASAVAAIKCTRPGGRAGAPDLAATLEHLQTCQPIEDTR
ncbi:MAG: PfkB family carbohydrate kinase [Lautropia sp.]